MAVFSESSQITTYNALEHRSTFFSFSFQLVNKQLEQAQQELSSASTEEDKAKASIAVECAEALLKALH